MTPDQSTQTNLLQGTLDLLVLKSLSTGELHGLGVSGFIRSYELPGLGFKDYLQHQCSWGGRSSSFSVCVYLASDQHVPDRDLSLWCGC